MKAIQLLLTVLALLSTSARSQLRHTKATKQVANNDSPPKLKKKMKMAETMDKQKYTKSRATHVQSTSAPTLMQTVKPTLKPTAKPTIANSDPTPPAATCDPAIDPECDDP
jgi:hypothetical protein